MFYEKQGNAPYKKRENIVSKNDEKRRKISKNQLENERWLTENEIRVAKTESTDAHQLTPNFYTGSLTLAKPLKMTYRSCLLRKY